MVIRELYKDRMLIDTARRRSLERAYVYTGGFLENKDKNRLRRHGEGWWDIWWEVVEGWR